MSPKKLWLTTQTRMGASLLALGLIVGLGTGCPDDSGGDEDTGTAADVTDGGDTVTDTGSDDAADSTVEDTDEADPDTGTPDTGPPGEEVTARSFFAMSPIAANCREPGKRQRIPFYFQTRTQSDLRAIKAGDIFRGNVVQPNQTIGANTLTSRRMRVAEASRTTCGSSSSCTAPLKCGDSGLRGSDRYCTRQTGIEFIPGSAKLDYDPNFSEDSGQLVTILVENTGMWEGLLPSLVGTKYDENGDDDFGAKKARATDPELKHREAIEQFATFLATANDPSNTKVGMWFFGGENRSRARPLLNAQEQTDHFDNDLQLPKDLVGSLPNPAPRPSNVYQSILQVIDRDLGIKKYEDHEKFLVLITDGPNEVWDEDSRKDKVIKRLRKHNIHLFVMHLDAEIDPSLLRDVPSYWAGNSLCRDDESCQGRPPCASDDSCASHETCRKATIYADSEGGMVTQTDAKYCMPDYSSGTLGPVDDYAQIACQTNGNYLYATDPQQLVNYAQHIPFLFNGQWSVEAELSALDEKVGLDDGYYRLSGVFFGLLGPNLSWTMSATSSSGANQHPFDSRGLIRKGGFE